MNSPAGFRLIAFGSPWDNGAGDPGYDTWNGCSDRVASTGHVMKRLILAAAVVLGLADASPARAQFFVRSGWGGGFGYGYRGGLGFSYHGHHLRAFGFAGYGGFGGYGLGYRSFGYGGFPYGGFGYGGFGRYYARSTFYAPYSPFFAPFASPVFPSIARLTPFGLSPGFLTPGWGIGPTFGWNPVWAGSWGWWGPPPILGLPFAMGGDAEEPDLNVNPNRNAVAAAPPAAKRAAPEPAPLGAKPGDFLVIAPRKDFPPPGGIAPDLARVAAPPPPELPVFRFDPFAKPPEVNVEKAAADPAKEAARLLKLGREAFAAGEYGKAGEQFGRASAAQPKAAEPHFLKAQAAFAAGAYADAVDSIRAGLALDPTWPASRFDPKEPYGVNVIAFAEQLATLRKVAAANPGEPSLEFLLGYELWFIGEKAEAKKWFEAAAKTLPAPGPLALFK
jgi:hypothetical protein